MAMNDVLQRLSVELALDATEFATGSTRVQRGVGRLRDSIAGLGDSWMRTGRQMSLGVTAPLTAFGVLSAKAASDAQELQSAFEQTFGSLAPMMNDWAEETGNAMGRATTEMQEMANTFGIFFNQAAPNAQAAAEMSQTFSVLAQDLASFFNVDAGTALDKLRSGLSGEAEPLRDFGVFLNAANVEARALEMGLGDLNGELSEQDKILARYNLILEGTKSAQGDVARTSGSTANQARAFGAAMDELQVVIGEKLLPVITPLITGATGLINAFTNLPSGVQTAVVAFGALAAAIGPMMLIMGTLAATILPLFAARFGPIGLAISAFINPLGTAISLLAQFIGKIAGMAILKRIAGLVLRFAGPVGALVTLGALVSDNWDRITQVFAEFRTRASEAIGPPLQRLVTTLQAAFEKLWGGPLGEGIRSAVAVVEEFGASVWAFMGDRLIATLEALLDVVVGVFEQIGIAIDFVNALLNGDTAAAWSFAQEFITNAIETIFNAIDIFTGGALTAIKDMVVGVGQWLGDKLGAIFDSAREKIEWVTKGFRDMYIAVVGNSYVPDMIDGIASEFSRLDTVMVRPALKAANDVEEATRELARRVRGHLSELFPNIEAERERASQIADLFAGERAGLIGADTRREAVRRAQGINQGPLGEATQVSEAGERIIEGLENQAKKARTATVRIAESFGDMAEDSIRAMQRLERAITSGGFLDILGGIIGLGLQLGSTGLFGSTIARNINTALVPGFANGTSFAPGGLAWVGERGPELVDLPRGSRVIPNHELRAANDDAASRVMVGIDPRNGNVTAYVDRRIEGYAPSIADAGGQVAQRRIAKRNTRRIA